MSKKNWLLCCVLITLFTFLEAADDSPIPVFLSDYKKVLTVNIDTNPFSKMENTDFTNVLKDVKKNAGIVLIFVEPTLSMEDVSLKDDSGTPYFYLSQGIKDGNVKFLPSVMLPYNTITDVFPQNVENTFYLSGISFSNNIKQKMYYSKLKHFYIWFQYEKETRTNLLRNHDRIMQEIYLTLGNINPGPVVSIYTGKGNPIDLQLLNTPKIRFDQEIVLQSSGAMFRFAGEVSCYLASRSGTGFYTSLGTEQRKYLFGQVPLITDETRHPNVLSTRVAYLDYEMEFNFYLGRDNWVFDNVTLHNLGATVGLTRVGGVAPWNSSYACAHPLEIVHAKNGTAIVLSRYQLQPFLQPFQEHTDKRRAAIRYKKFGPVVSCTPCFSAPILAGLLVTFLCSAILMCAVVFLNDCHSNDRYDDPHGKSLMLEKIN